RVGLGRRAGHSELLGRPQADQLVAPRTSLEPKFLIVREFALEPILALVERAHRLPHYVAQFEIRAARRLAQCQASVKTAWLKSKDRRCENPTARLCQLYSTRECASL